MYYLSSSLGLLIITFSLCQDLPKPEQLVQITPTDFFSGELKRLESHVDFKGACFKVAGNAADRCRPDVEMWCDGKRVDRPKYGVGFPQSDNEISFTWRRLESKDGPTKFKVNLGGLFPFGRVIDEPKSTREIKVTFGPVVIEKPVVLKKGGSAIVWAIGAGNGIDLGKPEEAEKMLKTLPWVMILRLRFDK